LTNNDANDEADPRIAHALGWLGRRSCDRAEDCVAALKELCSQTGNGAPPICLHGNHRGTVSSTIVALRKPLERSTYLHAQGPPDRVPYADVSFLLRELRAGA
jgi:hypothetical protein